MEQHDREELAEVNAARKGFYEFLASMYKLELTDEQIGTLTKQDLPTDAEYVGAGYATVKEYLRHRDSGTRQELAVDYARVFLCAGMYEQLMAPPYESVYTSEGGLMMQDAYAEVLHVYRGAGFAKNPGFKEPEDHLAVELAFMALLCGRAVEALRAGDEAGAERQLRAQREFLSDHLLNWIDRFTSDVRKAAEDGFYFDLATFTEDFLTADAAELAEVLG